MDFSDLLSSSPVIAAVKSETELNRCKQSSVRIVFLLYGNICNVGESVDALKQAGKAVFVHMDLIDGLAPRESAVDYLARHTSADGIISTKAPLLRYAHEIGLMTIRRFFLLDSIALETVHSQANGDIADAYEILPGVMPKIIADICADLSRPVIAGGLIRDKEDVIGALSAGASAVSSTNSAVWFL